MQNRKYFITDICFYYGVLFFYVYIFLGIGQGIYLLFTEAPKCHLEKFFIRIVEFFSEFFQNNEGHDNQRKIAYQKHMINQIFQYYMKSQQFIFIN